MADYNYVNVKFAHTSLMSQGFCIILVRNIRKKIGSKKPLPTVH